MSSSRRVPALPLCHCAAWLSLSRSQGCCLLVFLFPQGRVGGPGRRLGGCCCTLGFGPARGLPGGMVMCLCCTRFPRTTLSRANSAQQSAAHKASYLPRCASPAPGRWSHCKATASPANPPDSRLSARSTWSNAQQRSHRAFHMEPVILCGLSPVLPLTPVRSKSSAQALRVSLAPAR